MDSLIVVTNRQELREIIREIAMEFAPASSQEFMPEEKMIRRDAARFLDVSYQTMYNWTKSGVLKEHGNGRKKFYLRSELIDCLKKNVS